jgi:hypothetical protein
MSPVDGVDESVDSTPLVGADETAGVVSGDVGGGGGIAKMSTVFETPPLLFTLIDNSQSTV